MRMRFMMIKDDDDSFGSLRTIVSVCVRLWLCASVFASVWRGVN